MLSTELLEPLHLLGFIVVPLLVPVYEQLLNQRKALNTGTCLFEDFSNKGLRRTLTGVHPTTRQLYICPKLL